MRGLGGAVVVCLFGLGGCSDPVTSAVVTTELVGHKLANVADALPATRAELLPRLTEYGYKPDDPARCEAKETLACAGIWAPEIEQHPDAKERLYFYKSVSRPGSGETYGLVVDLGTQGDVLKAISFKTANWVF